MKHCTECKHYVESNTGAPEFGRCSAYIDPHNEQWLDWIVTGKGTEPDRFPYCRVERNGSVGHCGQDARNFEPKEIA